MEKVEIKMTATQPANTATDVRDRVKTFEDACRETNCFPEVLTVTGKGLDEKEINAVSAFHKLSIIAKALNEGWAPDWNNSNQYKYYPYFDMQNGFAFVVYDDYYQLSLVGSRLCFKSSELATYAGKQFLKEYEQLMVL